MVTCKLLGVFPLLGVTASQVRPTGGVAAVAWNGSVVLGSVLVPETVCVAAKAPGSTVRLMAARLTLSSAVLLTFSVTGITSGGVVEPGTLSVILPAQVFGVSPVVLTETTT